MMVAASGGTPGTLLLGLGLVGCGGLGQSDSSGWTDPAADDDWSGLVEIPERRAEWTAEEVGQQIDAALASGVPDPGLVFESYEELLSHGDDDCPGSTFNGGFLVVGICSTSDGYQFSGSAGVTIEDTRVVAEDGSFSGAAMRMSSPADYLILRPDGTGLAAGGNLTQRVSSENGQVLWSTEVRGSFRDDGVDGWLGAGFSATLRWSGREDSGVVYSDVIGDLTLHGISLQLEDFHLSPETCSDGAELGTIMLRQHDATWYTLTLDGPCSRCGDVVWDDREELGEACVDLEPLIAAVASVPSW
jgi:hypothetical protein